MSFSAVEKDEPEEELNEIKQRLEMSVGDIEQKIIESKSKLSHSVSESGSDKKSLNGSLHR